MTITQIPEDKLVEGAWYMGRGRNANVALWVKMKGNMGDRFTFLTIGFTFKNPVIKDEGYYMDERHCGTETKDGKPVRQLVSYGCFQPFQRINEGQVVESIGTEPGWDKHYAVVLEVL